MSVGGDVTGRQGTPRYWESLGALALSIQAASIEAQHLGKEPLTSCSLNQTLGFLWNLCRPTEVEPLPLRHNPPCIMQCRLLLLDDQVETLTLCDPTLKPPWLPLPKNSGQCPHSQDIFILKGHPTPKGCCPHPPHRTSISFSSLLHEFPVCL